ncbi:MAG TPA: DUF885 domain-containing protein [Flavipsychrobacter sp.]|nr:DUF885 domain-containing protein [Flavipsychrobacter sp.]
MRKQFFIALLLVAITGKAAVPAFQTFVSSFVVGYRELHIPEIGYGYRDYFTAIPGAEQLDRQEAFFKKYEEGLAAYKRAKLSIPDRVVYDHLAYEVAFNLQRIKLEKEWVAAGREMPQGGLSGLNNIATWYPLFVQRFTTVSMPPGDVLAFGEQEVRKVKSEIATLQEQLGFSDSATFYMHLNSETFFITDKEQLLFSFEEIDKWVRQKLSAFIGTSDVPLIYAMEWPEATAFTPPGIYLNRADNAYGKDVFQFNFYNGRYNKRAMEWLYMHEAIPGHHLQFSLQHESNSLQDLFFYPGNFEGWACYVEYFGKDVGLYSDPYMYLGKWEWDLVRSVRLVLDVGIHYYGWSREKALAYWKKAVPNQDDIAEREVTRVTDWPCQALSYKMGAAQIFKMQKWWQQQHTGSPLSDFRKAFLAFGRLPLPVIEKNIS